MPRNNSLVGKVRRALKGMVITARTEQELRGVVFQKVRAVIHRNGVRKDSDVITEQSEYVTQALSKEIQNLQDGGVKISL